MRAGNDARWVGDDGEVYITIPAGFRHGRRIDETVMRADVVMWAMAKGTWPKGEVVHLDGDKMNLRLANLRDAGANG